jgi:hypothetical protein
MSESATQESAIAAGSRRPWLGWVLAVVFVCAVCVRLTTISGVLPAVHHPDEPTNEKVVLRVAHDPFHSPDFFNYPTLFFYVEGAVARVYEATTGNRIVPVRSLSSGNVHTSFPGFWIAARSTTALLGGGVATLAAAIAGLLTTSAPIALLTGLWAALSPVLVEDSRYVTPDTYAAFFTMAALLGALRLAAETAGWKTYAVAGVMVGLAGGSKYNVALVAAAVVVAHLSRASRRSVFDPHLWLAGACAVAAFAVTTPFALFDYVHFRKDLSFEAEHYQRGHAGAEGSSLAFNVSMLWTSEGFRWCALPLLVFLRERRLVTGVATVAAFALLYFGMISSLSVHFLRNLVPVVGPLLVLSALGFSVAFRFVSERRGRTAALATLVAFGVLTSVQPAIAIVRLMQARRINPRGEAEAWIPAHLAPGSRIAIEPYGPWVDPERYRVTGIARYGETSPRDLERKQIQYVILAEGSYGRYYADPGHYGGQVAKYDALLHGHCELARFRQAPGSEIRIVDLGCKPGSPGGP